MDRTQKLVTTALLFFTLPLFTTAQSDAHYWTNQFGAKGLLLNGAVIASTEDESAIFYNPGAMGNGEEFGLSLSFFTPTFAVLRTKDYLGAGSIVRDKNLGFASGYGAIGFKPFKSEKLRASIASFSRYRSDLRLRAREVGNVENQSEMLFLGDLEFQRSLSERWWGFGLAYRVNENLSVGATQFITFHSENTSLTIQKEIVHKDNPYELLLGWRSKFKYSFSTRGGLLTKFGLSAKLGNMKIGLVATTPTYYNYSGSAGYDLADLKSYGRDSTVLLSNLTDAEVKKFKSPWSVGLGLDFTIKKTRVSFSTEYFRKIPRYAIIEDTDDPFDGLANGGREQTTVVQTENQTVLNVALGLQTRRSEKSTIILGFRTDFNQRIIGQDLQTLNFLSTTPSVFHFSFGGLFTFKNSQFSMGADYAFGRKKTDGRLVDLSNITPENLFEFSGEGSVKSRYQSVVFIFTYDFILKSWKERKRKNGGKGAGGD